MTNNYHTHTKRCHHAAGEDREYVEAAIAAGLKTLGFSDHSPYIFPEEAGDYYSPHRMRPGELAGYVESIESLKSEFKGKIRILTGVEIEYYPSCFGETESFLNANGIEYMILGQHYFGNEYDAGSYPSYGANTCDIAKFEAFTTRVVECIESKKFLYIAHPDIFTFRGDEDLYRGQCLRVCEASKRFGVPLEINIYGYATDRFYPNKIFWETAGETGCPVIFGIDAHKPSLILKADGYAANIKKEFEAFALRYVEDLNI